MTVAELIAKLKHMPQDAAVSVRADGDFCEAAVVYAVKETESKTVAIEG